MNKSLGVSNQWNFLTWNQTISSIDLIFFEYTDFSELIYFSSFHHYLK